MSTQPDNQPSAAGVLATLPPVFGRSEALAAGLSERTIRTLSRQGITEQVGRGRYAKRADLPDDDAPLHQRRKARHVAELSASLSLRTGYAASHLSAALLHGLDTPSGEIGLPQITAITAFQRSRRAPTNGVHHCDSTLTTTDTVDDLLVTSVARTVADCLRTMPMQKSVPIADSAIRLHGITMDAIEAELATQCRWVGRPKALAALPLIDGRRETWLESFSFTSLALDGFELPVPQVEIFDEFGNFIARVDGLWASKQCVAEADGKQKYDLLPGESIEQVRRRVLLAEKQREEGLRAVGLGCVRWGTDEAYRDRPAIGLRIRREWARTDLGPFRGVIRIPDPTGRTKCAV